MTVTTLTGPGRVAQFLWGARAQNTLSLGYPIAVDNPRFWREPQAGSELTQVNDGQDAWVTTRDFWAALTLRWVDVTHWSGLTGVQAFLDWGAAAGSFTCVPDAVNAPLFGLPGCLLVEPFMPVTPNLEADGSQAIDIVFRNPTYDLGLAWR